MNGHLSRAGKTTGVAEPVYEETIKKLFNEHETKLLKTVV